MFYKSEIYKSKHNDAKDREGNNAAGLLFSILGPLVFSDPICCPFLTWFGHYFSARQFLSVRIFLISVTTWYSRFFLLSALLHILQVALANRQIFNNYWTKLSTISWFVSGKQFNHCRSRTLRQIIDLRDTDKSCCYIAKQNKSKIWKLRWDSSDHVQQRSTFRG